MAEDVGKLIKKARGRAKGLRMHPGGARFVEQQLGEMADHFDRLADSLEKSAKKYQGAVEIAARKASAAFAAEAGAERLKAALEPFAEFAKHAVDAEGWTSNVSRERICDWFGPSDFRAALASEKRDAG